MARKIDFRGEKISIEEAKRRITELSNALAATAPEMSDTPHVGQQFTIITDPRWYTEAAPDQKGALLCMRDPGLGWRGFILPWDGVALLTGYLAGQMAVAAIASNTKT